ncbi:MAG: multicopper oxidase domain-containing protein [Candidatus Symbiobacter sp.]|nr:multicopper oxidase domain-containing protein [Candidatus Symbiobacter sp.]
MKDVKKFTPRSMFLVGFAAGILLLSHGHSALAADAPDGKTQTTRRYELTASPGAARINGENYDAILVNKQFVSPTLRANQGDVLEVIVHNNLDSALSLHWHGVEAPPDMDGAAGLNGAKAISTGASFTYRIPVTQTGTYWYHAHGGTQEQMGVYGGLVFYPPGVQYSDNDATDRVIILADHSQSSPHEIFQTFKDDHAQGQHESADIYTMTANGKGDQDRLTYDFVPGQKLHLRLINAAAMTMFKVSFSGPTPRYDYNMTLVAADGQPVIPIDTTNVTLANGETRDIMVTPNDKNPFQLIATPYSVDVMGNMGDMQGMSGMNHASMDHADMKHEDRDHDGRKRGDRDHDGRKHGDRDHDGRKHGDRDHEDRDHEGRDHDGRKYEDRDHEGRDHSDMDASPPPANIAKVYFAPRPGSKAANAPHAKKSNMQANVFDNDNLLAADATALSLAPPSRTIKVRLTGDMQRYIWTINDAGFDQSEPIKIALNERVKIDFVNESGMAHPMHLHGMSFRPIAQSGKALSKRNTILVADGETKSVILDANRAGEWLLHCHLLYHQMDVNGGEQMGGMLTRVVVQ